MSNQPTPKVVYFMGKSEKVYPFQLYPFDVPLPNTAAIYHIFGVKTSML